jgi:hypothetical protein
VREGSAVSTTVRLDDASIEALARRVVELLRSEDVGRERRDHDDQRLLDPSEVARRFGVSRAYVYEHGTELGAIRLGHGPRPRLRFDPALVSERLAASSSAAKPEPRRGKTRRHQSRIHGRDRELLPIRGGDA